MLILNTLAPVFLVIALGVLLQRREILSRGFLVEANKLSYWVGLPSLLFIDTLEASPHLGAAKPILEVVMAGCAGAIVLGYVLAPLLRIETRAVGTFVQACFRGNLAFIGLPIIYAFPDTHLAGGLSLRAAAVLVIGPSMVVYNIVGVTVLLLSQHALGPGLLKTFARQLVTTPPLIATAAGLLACHYGISVPKALSLTFHTLADLAFPLGLLGIGGALASLEGVGGRSQAVIAACVKTAFAPIVGYFVGRWMGLGALELKTALIFLAAPTAIISYPMVVELKGDAGLAASAIAGSVLTSIPALMVVIGLL